MFKLELQVVCIKKNLWLVEELNEFDDIGPKFNEIVTICGIVTFEDGVYLRLSEYINEGVYHSKNFCLIQNQYTEEEIESVDISELEKIEFETIDY